MAYLFQCFVCSGEVVDPKLRVVFLDRGCFRMSTVGLGANYPPGTDWLRRFLAFPAHLIGDHATSCVVLVRG